MQLDFDRGIIFTQPSRKVALNESIKKASLKRHIVCEKMILCLFLDHESNILFHEGIFCHFHDIACFISSAAVSGKETVGCHIVEIFKT